MMTEFIIACPFCGEEHTTVIKRTIDGSNSSATVDAYVVCNNRDCEARGPVKTTREDAITAWNTRWLPFQWRKYAIIDPVDGMKTI